MCLLAALVAGVSTDDLFAQEGRIVQLPDIVVGASRQGPADSSPRSATGPIQGYVAKTSATGTKTATRLLETPQSISVIGARYDNRRKALFSLAYHW